MQGHGAMGLGGGLSSGQFGPMVRPGACGSLSRKCVRGERCRALCTHLWAADGGSLLQEGCKEAVALEERGGKSALSCQD